MANVKVSKHTSYTVTEGDLEFEVEHEPDPGTDVIVRKMDDGNYVVGYLVQDDDCPNPLEDCDGIGTIIDRRHCGLDKEREVQKAIGVIPGGRNPYAVLLDVYSHSGDTWRVHGSGKYFPDERWDVSRGAGVWLPDECCIDEIRSRAIKAMLPDGVQLEWTMSWTIPCTEDKHPRRTVQYILSDGRKRKGYKTFEAAGRAAARVLGILPNKTSVIEAERKAAFELAGEAVATYNAWCSGDCWGVCVEVFTADGDRVSEDACWGHLGHKYAKETLQGEVDSHVNSVSKEEVAA